MSVRTPARIPNDADRMNALTKASPMLRAGVTSTAGLLTLSLFSPAHAHHPFGMGDSTDLSALQGLMSGIGHPLLGPDHLLFLLAIAFVGLQRPRTWVIPLLAAGLGGSVFRSSFPCRMPWLPGRKLWCLSAWLLRV